VPTTSLTGRSAAKRQLILSAGQQLFLEHGYRGTSMDQVAATASVSKQTVYKHFGEKRELLFAIVTDALDGAAAVIGDQIAALPDTTDLETDLAALAGHYLRAVLQEQVVQLRRLVIGEASRLPELARLYYEHAPLRTLSSLADAFAGLHERGALNVPEPSLAAEHFAFLIVGRAIDQALFDGAHAVLAAVDVDSYARAGVNVFLAAYRSR
jgi:TetR/AcrR family transcriptional regulator, mexJK operon transcriptional repressor